MSEDDTKLPDVWATRDYPVLREVVRRMDADRAMLMPEYLLESAGNDPDTLQSALLALMERGLIRGTVDRQAWGPTSVTAITGISGAAYLVTGLHPAGDDALSQLVSALHQAADQSSDEDERGRLRRAADGLVGVSGKVGTAVLTAWVTAQIPT